MYASVAAAGANNSRSATIWSVTGHITCLRIVQVVSAQIMLWQCCGAAGLVTYPNEVLMHRLTPVSVPAAGAASEPEQASA